MFKAFYELPQAPRLSGVGTPGVFPLSADRTVMKKPSTSVLPTFARNVCRCWALCLPGHGALLYKAARRREACMPSAFAPRLALGD